MKKRGRVASVRHILPKKREGHDRRKPSLQRMNRVLVRIKFAPGAT
jgi:hypothetical protein